MLTDQDKKEITSLFSNAFAQGVNELIAPGMSRMLEDMDDIKERLGNVEIRLGNVETQLGNVEIRLGQVETRVGSLEEIVESHSEQFSIMHLRRIPRACPWMNAILVTYKYLH